MAAREAPLVMSIFVSLFLLIPHTQDKHDTPTAAKAVMTAVLL